MPASFGLDLAAFNLTSAKGSLSIRPVAAADRAAWNALWKGYLDFYETSLPAAQYELTFNRFLDPEEAMYAYLAERGGVARGLVHIILHRSGWLDRPTCYLQDLYVDPGERGAGVGRALIEHVCAVMKAAGGARVYWLTHETNAAARKLYDRLATSTGFVQYARKV